jgi:hypothetical protein
MQELYLGLGVRNIFDCALLRFVQRRVAFLSER